MGLVANRVKRHGNESKNTRCSKYDDNFQFLAVFGCTLGEQLLRQSDDLSRDLQDSSTSAAQGNRLAQDVVKALQKDRLIKSILGLDLTSQNYRD